MLPRSIRIWPGQASTRNSVPLARKTFKPYRLCDLPELKIPDVIAADGDLPGDIFQFDIVTRAPNLNVAPDANRPNDIAGTEFDPHVAREVLQANTGIVAVDVDVAIDVGDIEVSPAAMRFDPDIARDRNFQIAGDEFVPSAAPVRSGGADVNIVPLPDDLPLETVRRYDRLLLCPSHGRSCGRLPELRKNQHP